MRSTMKYLFAIPLFLTFTGCVNAPIEGRQDPHARQQIYFTDRRLKESTAVDQPQPTRIAGGLLQVTVPIRSTVNRSMTIDYRVTWLDANGQPLPGSPTTWMSHHLEARAQDYITTNSTSSRAADFQIDFRPAK